MTPGQAEQVAAAKVESVVFVGWCTCTMNRKVLNSPRRPTCARLVYVRTSGTRSRWPRMSRRERLSNVVRRRADRPRTKTDKIYALEDRCAHRQMPLSCGVVVGETLRCCYRARFYDEDGSCAVPLRHHAECGHIRSEGLCPGVRIPRRLGACRDDRAAGPA